MEHNLERLGTEQELAGILSHYNTDFVYDILHSQIERIKTTGFSLLEINNLVGAWELNFKAINDEYGAENESSIKISDVRRTTYEEIINIICKEFNLDFTIADVDYFTAAWNLYDFFITNFRLNIVIFFSRFIYRERASLYESMNLSELKKNKDSSTIYGKRIYKDIRLAVITANLYKILNQICNGLEFNLATFLDITLEGEERKQADYLLSIISEKGNFFAETVLPIIQNNTADYITNIRLAIQEYAVSNNQIIYTNTTEEEVTTNTTEE